MSIQNMKKNHIKPSGARNNMPSEYFEDILNSSEEDSPSQQEDSPSDSNEVDEHQEPSSET